MISLGTICKINVIIECSYIMLYSLSRTSLSTIRTNLSTIRTNFAGKCLFFSKSWTKLSGTNLSRTNQEHSNTVANNYTYVFFVNCTVYSIYRLFKVPFPFILYSPPVGKRKVSVSFASLFCFKHSTPAFLNISLLQSG